MIDLLVSIAVIAVLIGILLPSLSGALETSKRVACRSNVRQIGMGLSMFADDHRGELPKSVFRSDIAPPPGVDSTDELDAMMCLRLGPDQVALGQRTNWDGVGLIYAGAYVDAPKVFYCPSYHAADTFNQYAKVFSPVGKSQIVGNYHYRGTGPNHTRLLFRIEPSRSSLVSDGIRSFDDFSHRVGANVLRADLSVEWVPDTNGSIQALLLSSGAANSAAGNDAIDQTWSTFDSFQSR